MPAHAHNVPHARHEEPFLLGLRRRAGALILDWFFTILGALGRLHPWAKASDVERLRDIPYRATGLRDHLLDIYRPAERSGLLPIVIHIHGGSFRVLSKDTHWSPAIIFARAGCLCFNINYRLAPKHRFPSQLEDAVEAYRFVLEHAEEYGGDPKRVIVAGESAGGNLTLALAVAASYAREEESCRRIFELDHQPLAIVPTCGILDLEDPERFAALGVRNWLFMDRIRTVSHSYLPFTGEAPMASPLRILEESPPPARAFPPTFVGCGGADPILDDSRRLKPALDTIGAPCVEAYYAGETHAFNLQAWTDASKQYWSDVLTFLHEIDPAIRKESTLGKKR